MKRFCFTKLNYNRGLIFSFEGVMIFLQAKLLFVARAKRVNISCIIIQLLPPPLPFFFFPPLPKKEEKNIGHYIGKYQNTLQGNKEERKQRIISNLLTKIWSWVCLLCFALVPQSFIWFYQGVEQIMGWNL